MDITINTPALLFPAISLVMLAYTNRFMALSVVVRKLHDEYQLNTNTNLQLQIKNLQYRLKLVRRMQFFGVMSFLLGMISMYLVYTELFTYANILFGLCMISFSISLVLSLVEILKSTKALELELSDMEGIKDDTFVEYIRKKFEKE